MADHMLKRSDELGYDVWPSPIFHPAEGDFYLARHLFQRLNEDVQDLLSKGFGEKEIAKLFTYPSRISLESLSLIGLAA
jgi:hypothetical protein